MSLMYVIDLPWLLEIRHNPMELYHPLDGNTNLKYKLLCFLTLNKNNFKEEGTSF